MQSHFATGQYLLKHAFHIFINEQTKVVLNGYGVLDGKQTKFINLEIMPYIKMKIEMSLKAKGFL